MATASAAYAANVMRGFGRVLWWVLAYERPTRLGDCSAVLVLFGLLGLGALALAWPWLSVEVPRGLATGLSIAQAVLAAWWRQLIALLPRFG